MYAKVYPSVKRELFLNLFKLQGIKTKYIGIHSKIITVELLTCGFYGNYRNKIHSYLLRARLKLLNESNSGVKKTHFLSVITSTNQRD